MLRTRVITALIAIPIVVGGVFAGGLWFLGGVGLVALIAGWEFGRMMRTGGYQTTPFFTLGLIIFLLLHSYRSDLSLACILSLTLLSSLTWQLFQAQSASPTADWALTLIGGLYIGWGMAHLVALRGLANGLAWVWLVLLCTWGADTFAYLIGSRWGRHKLWPRLSPKKSWEGFVGGIFGSLLGAAGVAILFDLSWGTCLFIGLIIPIVDLFGDVSISMMKRDIGVKDSSNLFPGHGGFLDRIDSLLFVSVVVYYYAVWSGAFGPTVFESLILGSGF
jgi:phosphatidate cytidylyltransferase